MAKERTRFDFYRDVAEVLGITEHINRIDKIEMSFIAGDAPRMRVYFILDGEEQGTLTEVIKKYKWVEEEAE